MRAFFARTLARPGTPARPAAAILAAVITGGAALAGCGSAARPAAARPAAPAAPPLATSLAAGPVTWAVVPMGAAAPGPNQFWQLFLRPAGGGRWVLATPPDVATNGALAAAPAAGQALTAGVRPTLSLDFSPVTATADGGRNWSAGTPDPGLARVPDALAAAPHGAGLIALDQGRGGPATAAAASSATAPAWSALTTAKALAGTAAGRACGLAALTAAAFSPAGVPALGGTCRQPGVAGIFTRQSGTWRAAGPALPAALDGESIRVLRLTRTGSRLTALLAAGTGRAASLVAAWTAGGRSWTVSPPLPLAGAAVLSSSFGGDGAAAVTLSGRRSAMVAGPGAAWQALPALPAAPSVTLALPAGGAVTALATDRSVLTVWQLARPAGGPAWTKAQTTIVPIQYGSST
jgi:hypothetical protein